MTIAGVTDLYIYGVGFLYPAYQCLLHQNNPEIALQWQRYWVVFAIYFVFLETSELTLQMLLPLLRMIQILGITLMVFPKTQVVSKLYSSLVLPTFEKNTVALNETFSHIKIRAWQMVQNLRQVFEYTPSS